MNTFDNLKTDSSISAAEDSVGSSFGPVDSAVYEAKITMAYTDKSKGGALSLNITLDTSAGEVRETIWMTSGNAKGNKNTYERDGEKHYLPGFTLANHIALLTVGKEIGDVLSETGETKILKLYDYDAKKEMPVEKTVVTGLLNQEISVGILKKIVDKNVKNDNGEYVPSGEVREINEIDKTFRHRDGMSVAEILAQATEATFIDTWKKKFTGVVQDKSKKGVKPSAGLPGQAAATAKPSTSLFA